MKFSRNRFLLIAFLLLLALAVPLWSSSRNGLPVRVVPVQRGTVVSTITSTTSGSVEPRASAALNAELSARVTRQHVEEGERVAAGAPLISLNPAEQKEELAAAVASQGAARAKLAQARAKREDADRELRRTEALYRQRVLSRRLLDSARLEAQVSVRAVEEAAASVRQLERKAALARIRLEKSEIRAPFAGVVTRVHVDEGDSVAPGTKHVENADDSRTYVEAPIDEIDAAKVRVGQRARLIPDAYPDETLFGRIYEIAPIVSTGAETNRTIAVKLALEEGSRETFGEAGVFKLGMSVDVEVILAKTDDALHVPTFAVIERAGRKYVLVAEGGRAREREIETGLSNWETTEVTSGVSEGALVITSLNEKKLGDGVRVRVEGRDEGSGG
ncbi:MAG: efflux RND transporter periplasmic adaptor subunit [Myxococcota bacterium]